MIYGAQGHQSLAAGRFCLVAALTGRKVSRDVWFPSALPDRRHHHYHQTTGRASRASQADSHRPRPASSLHPVSSSATTISCTCRGSDPPSPPSLPASVPGGERRRRGRYPGASPASVVPEGIPQARSVCPSRASLSLLLENSGRRAGRGGERTGQRQWSPGMPRCAGRTRATEGTRDGLRRVANTRNLTRMLRGILRQATPTRRIPARNSNSIVSGLVPLESRFRLAHFKLPNRVINTGGNGVATVESPPGFWLRDC